MAGARLVGLAAVYIKELHNVAFAKSLAVLSHIPESDKPIRRSSNREGELNSFKHL
jgi:hypothetical protein